MPEEGPAFTIGMDAYCYKQFDKQQTNHIPCSKEHFLQQLRSIFQSGMAKLADGYAPFCKHLFVRNFTDALTGFLPITVDNEHLLRSGYIARTEKELPVLSRWFPRAAVADKIGKAQYLDVILYSREQVIKENEARQEGHEGDYEFDYYVISIKPQDVDHEIPMIPITMFRNTMITEGGSGVALDHDAYLRSVAFWQNHAIIADHA
ncbi:hypothetical protein, conserved [Babesia ovata]|uniref:Uncharacterized protein n=1 Tax=Babesia ovata TaxID=189622 RepID=A0A2H6K977_9APIC|nr:uncharacterized protein BOVATA_010400 [Babesia ovata]GBE59547.1 hypothetical protein, conserved [Babesia ovata]